MKNKALFTSESEEWETPRDLFKSLDAHYHFKLDACATPKNAKCEKFFTKETDGLSQDWTPFSRVWMNPPYGRPIGKWMQKAFAESLKGCTVVSLVPARTDTHWWHDWVLNKGRVTFIKGRLRFNRTGAPDDTLIYSAPFPSVLVTYEPDLYRLLDENRGLPKRVPCGNVTGVRDAKS